MTMILFDQNGQEPYYYSEPGVKLIHGDSFKILPEFKPGVFDMIFADPPYFLSDGGISCHGGKQTSVNKGTWDTALGIEEKHRFNRRWIHECKRVLKPNGTIWVSGTFHNIYSVGMALEQEGFKILNNITWLKKNPPPNLACRCFTHSTETLLWAKLNSKKSKHYFNYALMKEINEGKQMKDVWCGSLTPKKEKTEGKHPTQKPEYLIERLILASTQEGGKILDPFVGSGTTAVVAKRLRRECVGIDMELDYLEIAKRRIEKELQN